LQARHDGIGWFSACQFADGKDINGNPTSAQLYLGLRWNASDAASSASSASVPFPSIADHCR
jgi:hypothetical protein